MLAPCPSLLPGTRSSTRRVLSHQTVHRLADEVGMPVVTRVFLDHVEQDVAQAAGWAVRPAGPSRRSAFSHRRSEQRARAGHGVAPERVELFGGIIGGGAPVPGGVGPMTPAMLLPNPVTGAWRLSDAR